MSESYDTPEEWYAAGWNSPGTDSLEVELAELCFGRDGFETTDTPDHGGWAAVRVKTTENVSTLEAREWLPEDEWFVYEATGPNAYEAALQAAIDDLRPSVDRLNGETTDMSACDQRHGGYFCALPGGHRGGTHESCGGHQWPGWLLRWLRMTRATMRCPGCWKPFRSRRRYARHYLARHASYCRRGPA